MNHCESCRYWSELITLHIYGHMRAACLKDEQGKMTSAKMGCEQWAHGYDGAIDDPKKDGTRYDD